MSSISSLEYERNQYEQLKQQIGTIYKKLDIAAQEVSKINPAIEKNYKLGDNSSSISAPVNEVRNEIDEERGYLMHAILPEIDNQIYRIDSEIARLEEEERLRAEAEANGQNWWNF